MTYHIKNELSEERYNEELKLIKRYLTLRPNSTKLEISSLTNVPIEDIDKFIEDEVITLTANGTLKIEKNKKSKEDARKKFAENLRNYEKENINVNFSKTNNDPGSKLVDDLKAKYNKER